MRLLERSSEQAFLDMDDLRLAPRPAPALPAAEPNLAAQARQRRRIRWARFVALETLALALMIGSVIAGVSVRFAAESLTPIFRVLPVGAAAVAAILPIFFFGHPKRRRR